MSYVLGPGRTASGAATGTPVVTSVRPVTCLFIFTSRRLRLGEPAEEDFSLSSPGANPGRRHLPHDTQS